MKELEVFKCPNCNKVTLRPIECDCGNVFCVNCKNDNLLYDREFDCLFVHCDQCGKHERWIYID